MAIKSEYTRGIGRRKSSVARAYLCSGSGEIIVNKKPYTEYFGREVLTMILRQPLELLEKVSDFDIRINVKGGGKSGQAGAARLAVSRALIAFQAEDRAALKKGGFLKSDARRVERKKPGCHKARKKPQFSKR